MGEILEQTPVLLIIGVTSRYADAFVWAREQIEGGYGPLALMSPAFAFTETEYYTATMGGELKKHFVACEKPINPGELAALKRQTNAWETEYAVLGHHVEPRPLNLDPGYITPAKLVLASTKDHAHRVYLRDGIYAEVTLVYRHRQWQPMEWTYPDYRRADYQEFFIECREFLLRHRGS